MVFIESEKGNQKLNIKLNKFVGGYCPRGAIVWGAIVRGAIVLLPFFTLDFQKISGN
jgi:hypothetical protein